ncbi:MAG: hypothetical protein QW815_07655, partial [Nitrososphaerota archaeon]
EAMGRHGFVADAPWPSYDESLIDLEAEESEDLILNTLDDILKIVRVKRVQPKRVVIYTASKWKWDLYRYILQALERGEASASRLIQEAISLEGYKGREGEVSKFVKKVFEDARTLSKELKDRRIKIGKMDELKLFSDVREFFAKELKAEVDVYSEDDGAKYDPAGRAGLAQPYRPAIYIE